MVEQIREGMVVKTADEVKLGKITRYGVAPNRSIATPHVTMNPAWKSRGDVSIFPAVQ